MTEKRKWGLFAKIESREEGVRIAKDSASYLFGVGALQAALCLIGGYHPMALVDAAAWIACGFFIRQYYSHTAAIIALLLAAPLPVVALLNMFGARLGMAHNIFLALLIAWAATRAIQATFMLHNEKRIVPQD